MEKYRNENILKYIGASLPRASVDSEAGMHNMNMNIFSTKQPSQSYIDFSTYPDPSPDTNRSNRGGVSVPFPEKLHQVLKYAEENSLSNTISFLPHGRAFVIHNPKLFVAEIMPKFFKQSQFTSFQRQVNLYGFKRLTQGPDNGSYYHELFLKGRPGLVVNMKRTKIKGAAKSKSDPQTEPNFYEMPPIQLNVNGNGQPKNKSIDSINLNSVHNSLSSQNPQSMQFLTYQNHQAQAGGEANNGDKFQFGQTFATTPTKFNMPNLNHSDVSIPSYSSPAGTKQTMEASDFSGQQMFNVGQRNPASIMQNHQQPMAGGGAPSATPYGNMLPQSFAPGLMNSLTGQSLQGMYPNTTGRHIGGGMSSIPPDPRSSYLDQSTMSNLLQSAMAHGQPSPYSAVQSMYNIPQNQVNIGRNDALTTGTYQDQSMHNFNLNGVNNAALSQFPGNLMQGLNQNIGMNGMSPSMAAHFPGQLVDQSRTNMFQQNEGIASHGRSMIGQQKMEPFTHKMALAPQQLHPGAAMLPTMLPTMNSDSNPFQQQMFQPKNDLSHGIGSMNGAMIPTEQVSNSNGGQAMSGFGAGMQSVLSSMKQSGEDSIANMDVSSFKQQQQQQQQQQLHRTNNNPHLNPHQHLHFNSLLFSDPPSEDHETDPLRRAYNNLHQQHSHENQNVNVDDVVMEDHSDDDEDSISVDSQSFDANTHHTSRSSAVANAATDLAATVGAGVGVNVDVDVNVVNQHSGHDDSHGDSHDDHGNSHVEVQEDGMDRRRRNQQGRGISSLLTSPISSGISTGTNYGVIGNGAGSGTSLSQSAQSRHRRQNAAASTTNSATDTSINASISPSHNNTTRGVATMLRPTSSLQHKSTAPRLTRSMARGIEKREHFKRLKEKLKEKTQQQQTQEVEEGENDVNEIVMRENEQIEHQNQISNDGTMGRARRKISSRHNNTHNAATASTSSSTAAVTASAAAFATSVSRPNTRAYSKRNASELVSSTSTATNTSSSMRNPYARRGITSSNSGEHQQEQHSNNHNNSLKQEEKDQRDEGEHVASTSCITSTRKRKKAKHAHKNDKNKGKALKSHESNDDENHDKDEVVRDGKRKRGCRKEDENEQNKDKKKKSTNHHNQTDSNNNDDDNDNEKCCICLEVPESTELAKIDSCSHLYCFACIEQWADRENTCPQCKIRFTKIERVHKIKIGKKKGGLPLEKRGDCGCSDAGYETIGGVCSGCNDDNGGKGHSGGCNRMMNSDRNVKKVKDRDQRSDYRQQSPLQSIFAHMEAHGLNILFSTGRGPGLFQEFSVAPPLSYDPATTRSRASRGMAGGRRSGGNGGPGGGSIAAALAAGLGVPPVHQYPFMYGGTNASSSSSPIRRDQNLSVRSPQSRNLSNGTVASAAATANSSPMTTTVFPTRRQHTRARRGRPVNNNGPSTSSSNINTPSPTSRPSSHRFLTIFDAVNGMNNASNSGGRGRISSSGATAHASLDIPSDRSLRDFLSSDVIISSDAATGPSRDRRNNNSIGGNGDNNHRRASSSSPMIDFDFYQANPFHAPGLSSSSMSQQHLGYSNGLDDIPRSYAVNAHLFGAGGSADRPLEIADSEDDSDVPEIF